MVFISVRKTLSLASIQNQPYKQGLYSGLCDFPGKCVWMFSKKDLYRLLWPLIIEQLLNVLVGMVDVLMVSSVGEAAVSGVSLVDSISILVIQVLSALATGGAVVCSRLIGAKDFPKARKAAGQLMLVTILGAGGVALLCLLGGRAFLGLIFGSVTEEVMDNAWLYFRLTALSYPFLGLYNSSAALFRSMGNSRISMKTSLFMNGLNAAGNAFCIFVLKMGIAGVAIPTLVARISAALLITVLLHDPANPVRVSSIRDLVPNRILIGQILSIGIPNGMESGMFQFGKLILQSLVSSLGTSSIAAYAVACNLVTFLYLPGNSLSLGMITIVGQCIGARRYDEAKSYTRQLVGLNYLLLAFIATTMALGRNVFVGFYNLSPEAASIAAYMVLIHSLAMIIWPPSFCMPSAFRAAGEASFCMLVSVSIMWIFRVGGAYLFVRCFGIGVEGIWYAMFIDWIARFIIYLLHFRGFTDRLKKREEMAG